MVPLWILVVLCFGVNFTIWGTIGLLRLADGRLDRARLRPRNAGSGAHLGRRRVRWVGDSPPRAGLSPAHATPLGLRGSAIRPDPLTVDDVAVLMAAHNEELVIGDSLTAITALVPASHVHVVSDFSSDRTVELARACGVNVTETVTNVGKAGALELGIQEFDLIGRFGAVLLLDADTRLDAEYFERALPLLDDPLVAAVAGCCHSQWRHARGSLTARVLVAHRSRIYALTQRLLKYGQTWRWTNATHIVPGFASLYRTSVLPQITINPPGLVIEDFNMTFELYRKGLGRVAFTPAAKAFTQDPDTLRDYVRQTKRWSLGLWQTVRRHRLHLDLLSAVVGLLLLEVVSASLIFLALPIAAAVLALREVPALLHLPGAMPAYTAVAGHVSPQLMLLGILVPDYALTCAVAIAERRPRYLLYGLAFVPLRIVDAAVALYSAPRAWSERSTGRWTSPVRRAPVADVTVIDLRDVPVGAAGTPGEDDAQQAG